MRSSGIALLLLGPLLALAGCTAAAPAHGPDEFTAWAAGQDHVASVELDTAASFLLNPRHGRARLCAFRIRRGLSTCRCRARGAARAAAMACLPTLSCSLSCLGALDMVCLTSLL